MAWTGRLLAESNSWLASRVLTLTYRDECRPDKLEYSHIQEFNKRYRSWFTDNIDPDFRQRFFVVGEYGEESGNAHWHLIQYGQATMQSLENQLAKRIEHVLIPAWNDYHGFVGDMVLNKETAGYVCGYTLKKGENEAPFMRSSNRPGIGFHAVRDMVEHFATRWPGKGFSIPTWWSWEGKAYPISDGLRVKFELLMVEYGLKVLGKTTPEQRAFEAAMYARFGDPEFKRHRAWQRQEEERVYGKGLPEVPRSRI